MKWILMFYIAGSTTMQSMEVADMKQCNARVSELKKRVVVERHVCIRGDEVYQLAAKFR